MKVNTMHLLTLYNIVFFSIPTVLEAAGEMVYRTETITTGDRIITSKDYPKPYPPNLNFTWLCSSSTVKWAVYFHDFQLDAPSGNFREYDWLELDDGVKKLRYSSLSEPQLPYKSSGHYMKMTFITDSLSGGKARGFKMQLLQGKDDQEIAVKIHALKTRKAEESDDDDDNTSLLLIIIAVVAAILFIAIVAVTVLCLQYRRRASSRTLTLTDRNAFGVRRNSGVYHSRDSGAREQHTSEVVIVARQTHRLPSDSQQNASQAPVQRSNSQRDWRARAELCAMMPDVGTR